MIQGHHSETGRIHLAKRSVNCWSYLQWHLIQQKPGAPSQFGEPLPAVVLGTGGANVTTLKHAEIGSAALPIHHAVGHPRHGETANAEGPISQKSAIAETVARAPRSTSDARQATNVSRRRVLVPRSPKTGR